MSAFISNNLDVLFWTVTASCGHNGYGKQINGGKCYAVLSSDDLKYYEAGYACNTRRGVIASVADPADLVRTGATVGPGYDNISRTNTWSHD